MLSPVRFDHSASMAHSLLPQTVQIKKTVYSNCALESLWKDMILYLFVFSEFELLSLLPQGVSKITLWTCQINIAPNCLFFHPCYLATYLLRAGQFLFVKMKI